MATFLHLLEFVLYHWQNFFLQIIIQMFLGKTYACFYLDPSVSWPITLIEYHFSLITLSNIKFNRKNSLLFIEKSYFPNQDQIMVCMKIFNNHPENDGKFRFFVFIK